MRVELMQKKHLPQVAALEAAAFSDPWSEKAFELLLGSEAVGVVACNEEGDVKAFGSMLWAPDEGQIINIAVCSDCRRQGLGNLVLESLITLAKEKECKLLSLEVRVSNIGAIALYEKHGFTVAGRRKNFYTNPREDAFVMLSNLGAQD